MDETCEYCEELLVSEIEIEEWWGAPVARTIYECHNKDCPGEFKECPECKCDMRWTGEHFACWDCNVEVKA